MEYKRFGNTVIARLDIGDEITAALKQVAEAEGIRLAAVSGIGACRNTEVGVFDPEKGCYNKFFYEDFCEITSLSGTFTTMDGKHYSHLHITLAAGDGRILGGHLFGSEIALTGEIVIKIIDGEVNRVFNPGIGINQITF